MGGLRQYYFFAIKVRLLHVHQTVERRVFVGRNARAGFKHGIEGFARVVGKARALSQLLGLKPLVQQEIQGGAQTHETSQIEMKDCPGAAKNS